MRPEEEDKRKSRSRTRVGRDALFRRDHMLFTTPVWFLDQPTQRLHPVSSSVRDLPFSYGGAGSQNTRTNFSASIRQKYQKYHAQLPRSHPPARTTTLQPFTYPRPNITIIHACCYRPGKPRGTPPTAASALPRPRRVRLTLLSILRPES